MTGYFFRKASVSYLAIFFISCATLSIEIAFTRLLSVITYYHMAFFAVSTAMLGMTAGAVNVFSKQHAFNSENLSATVANACLGFSLCSIVSAVGLCFIPIGFGVNFLKIIALLTLTFFCSLPFYFSGIVVTALLTKSGRKYSRMYAADLIGASLGCIFVLAGLNFFDAVSFIIFSGSLGALSYFLLKGKKYFKRSLLLFFGILLISFLNHFTNDAIHPVFVKGKIENRNDHLLERWNSFSRVLVFQKKNGSPQLWGRSPVAPGQTTEQYFMSIDGDAATVLRKYSSPEDGLHLKYDLTALAYYLRSKPGVCVIGVGGGKDIQTAISFGSKNVTGIDINPVFIDLLQHRFGKFTGIANHPEVKLKTDEARSFLSHTKETYDIIQMSLVDTWAATGAGAFSLSENNLYTVEAWQTFLNHLSDSGLLTVSRWYNPSNLGETGRLVSLAMAAAFKSGIKDPEKHIVLVTINNLATLILCKEEFSNSDILTLKQKINELQFHAVVFPGENCSNKILSSIINANSEKQLEQITKQYALNYKPPTDENPYFFNMLKLSHLNFKSLNRQQGIMSGNLQATITLLLLIACLGMVAFCMIILPLLLKSRGFFSDPKVKYEAGYFVFIGAGFMLVEIGMIQRLSVFLGHPVYGLAVLLFTMIFSAGIGSLLSAKIIFPKKKWLIVYPLAVALLITIFSFLIPSVTSAAIANSLANKIVISVLLTFPLGLSLGCFFPFGMQLVTASNSVKTPWYWALNGIFGVLFSAIAVFISIYLGISFNFYTAAFFYGFLSWIVWKLIS